MAFLRAGTGSEHPSAIEGRGIRMRAPEMSDYGPWAELRTLSRQHLSPWEPLWTRDELTRSAYRRRLKHYQREAWEDQGYAFLIFGAGDDRLLGIWPSLFCTRAAVSRRRALIFSRSSRRSFTFFSRALARVSVPSSSLLRFSRDFRTSVVPVPGLCAKTPAPAAFSAKPASITTTTDLRTSRLKPSVLAAGVSYATRARINLPHTEPRVQNYGICYGGPLRFLFQPTGNGP